MHQRLRFGNFLVVIGIALSSHAVRAQAPADTSSTTSPPPSDSSAVTADPWLQKLTLTSVQQQQVDTIHAQYRVLIKARLDSLSSALGSLPDDVTARLADLRSAHAAAVRTILTADQQPIFDENVALLEASLMKAAAPASAPQN